MRTILALAVVFLLAACGGGGGGGTSISVAGDTTPPLLSNGSPTGSLAEGTTTASLSFVTNEPATCRYTTSAGVAYDSMLNVISPALTLAHATSVAVTGGNSYSYYIKCRDAAGNTTPSDYLISFYVNPTVPGATGNPTILARTYVTRTVHIPGGAYTAAAPYIITEPNTEYILDGNISAEGSAILIRASRVVLNLNGYTITYNQTVPGEGVYLDAWNLSDIAITNGAIIQGDAMSEGDQYGTGNNPVRAISVTRMQIAKIYARYGGRDVSGFKLFASSSIIEENILDDRWYLGTLKNRHQGIDAIVCATGTYETHNIIRYNTIINARQRGIWARGYDQIYGNDITIRSSATNSYGIFGYAAKFVQVFNNTITGRGEHPIGIGFVSGGTDGIDIYNNTIDVKTTRIGEEYGGSPACFDPATPCGNYAVGFRTTWGGNNIRFHDNTVTVHTDSAYLGDYTPTGVPVLVNGKGRGLMVAINAGESSSFSNNTISALDKDGTGKAFGIACTGNNEGSLLFSGNTVTSNILNVALSDEYGYCAAHPLFYRNTLVKADNYAAYKTVAAELNGYFIGTGRFVSNSYSGGASQANIALNPAGGQLKSVYFGRELEATLLSVPTLTPFVGMPLTLVNGGVPFDSSSTTDAAGRAKLVVYDYELHDANNTSAVTLTRYLQPHTIQAVIGGATYATNPDAAVTAWDYYTSSGAFNLGVYLGGVLDPSKSLRVQY